MPETYNEAYYKSGCGSDYSDYEIWYNHFGEIADKIIADFHPKSVLDIGCAWGYLVAALRDRGVEAYGMDVSQYAISKVREDIQPYCFVASLSEERPEGLPEEFDLVTNIEVIEHLPEEETEAAMATLCRYSNTILFSSSPSDLWEPTHYNVQQSEYWIKRFAKQGFFRQFAYNVTYISPVAVCLMRTDRYVDVVTSYEHHYRRIKQRLDELTLAHQSLCSHTAALYFGDGQNYDYNHILRRNLDDYQICWEISLPEGTKTLRFDPVEQSSCIVRNIDITSNTGKLAFAVVNGDNYGAYCCFINQDPQLIIPIDDPYVTTVKIKAEIYPAPQAQLLDLVSDFKSYKAALEGTIVEKQTLEQEYRSALNKASQESAVRLACEKKLEEVNLDRQKLLTELHQSEDKLILMRTELHQSEDKLNMIQTKLHQSEDKLELMQTELSAKETRLQAITNSHSWRITRPVRALTRMLRRAKS